MRTVYLFNMISLDGYFEGPSKGQIDWHHVDAEFNAFAVDQLKATDMLLFGRITYELMAGYWPTPSAISDDPEVAHMMNAIPKAVFSRSLGKADWNNTQLIKTDPAEAVVNFKQQGGKAIGIFGSADFASTLTTRGLIDEYRLIVNPVVLGAGTPLFKPMSDRLTLKLLSTRPFTSGNVLLTYGPEKTTDPI
ncbi:MAG TPA: dihydrofolate reductase family protein [Aggregatilineales bacterium]|nr:dihydrofolate reductase family protein [Aggregatilineales bacterium]